MDNSISTLVITFDNQISQREIPLFRGAVLSKVPREMDVFHNHKGNSYRYRYPLIQYKRINNRATIVCVKEGTQAIGAFIASCDFLLKIGRRCESFKITGVDGCRFDFLLTDEKRHYTLLKWLALNGDNYETFAQLSGIDEKIAMLEHILIGNILSCCKGLNITVEDELKCEIRQVTSVDLYMYKGLRMTGFDIVFSANINLPDYIGLGKGVSLGYGILKQII